MAIGWLAVLQMVPWSDVIGNAPAVADGAKKLWNAVAKKAPSKEVPIADVAQELSPEFRAIATLEAKLTEMQTAAFEMHGQMLASSELIKALADQNAQLINRIEIHRKRFLWLSGATVVIGTVVVINITLFLFR